MAEGTPDELKAELRGDAIHVELADGDLNGRAVPLLAGVPGVHDPSLEGRTLRARAERGASAVPVVLSSLEAAGIGVASVTISRPSLDDVYLRHTGRSYSATQEVLA